MKVLIADQFDDHGIAALKELGCEVTCQPELSADALDQALAESEYRVLIVRSTRVNASAFDAGRSLGLVIRSGAGYNTIDVRAASQASVFVANCPGKNAVAVAELTFGLILALDRRIPDNVRDLRKKIWAKKQYSKARGLKGSTLGIIGVGRIGEEVAKRARAFDMRVLGWSRSLTDDKASQIGIERCANPEELAAASDVLSVHLAATPETDKFVGKRILDSMKPGSYFINTSRAEVVDYQALARVVVENGIRVGLDVFAQEPGASDKSFDDPFTKLDGVVYGTHHIGASTDEAQLAVSDETIAIIRDYLATGRVRNCVNLSQCKIPKSVLVVRHHNKPGVLASVLGELSQAGINVREMENVLCEGETGACAQIRLDQTPTAEVLDRIGKCNEHILGAYLTEPA